MRTFPFILRTAVVLSYALFLTPAASNAQVAAKDCTAGSGVYSCQFKDEAGDVSSGLLVLNQNSSSLGFLSTRVGNQSVNGLCACGLQGSVDDKDLPQRNKEVLCSDFQSTTPFALAGKISGNPTKSAGGKFGGELQIFNFKLAFNSTSANGGFLFDCNRQGNFTR